MSYVEAGGGGEVERAREAQRTGDERVRVLVVEDEPALRKALTAFVRTEGYDVEAAEDGEVALRALGERRPDIILLDLVLPKVDGYQVMEALAARYGRGRPRVVVMSAAERLDLARVRMDADAYIAKPFSPDRLRAALQRLSLGALRRVR